MDFFDVIKLFIFGLIFMFLLEILKEKIATNREKEKEKNKLATMSDEEKQIYFEQKEAALQKIIEEDKKKYTIHGIINPSMICPHCQIMGKISTRSVEQKKGVSGGKATAAVLTLGVSLLAVGLSRKEGATQAHCDNCNNTWFF